MERVRLMARQAQQLGAVLHSKTRAIKIETNQVTAENGQISCHLVIVAVDGKLELLLPELKSRVRTIPVLGNGDIWEAGDALRMMRATGCDGVIVGRGCLGRPWLFRELSEVLQGHPVPRPPNLREVCAILDEHARLLIEYFGVEMDVGRIT
mgnify:CR=1 FL=1